jgi:endoglucanase
MAIELKLLKTLSELPGISGHEYQVAKFIHATITPLADEVKTDQLGSVIAFKKSAASQRTIMLSAHIDEVGFLIQNIEESGMIRLQPVGGWWGHVVLAQRMMVTTKKGKTFLGVIGAKPPHGMSVEQRNKVLDIKDMFLDLGVNNKQTLLDLGIAIGDMVTPSSTMESMIDPKILLGKAWDNRISCAVLIELMKRLQHETLPINVAAAFTVQEEVGLRGAKTASYLVKPDLAFAIDVTLANDFPGVPKQDTALGRGVALSVMDGTVIAHRGLFDQVEKVAQAEKIPYTYDMMVIGGTDAGEIHKQYDGVITMTLSIPSRYFHSHVSLIHTDDAEATVNLIVAFIKQFSEAQLEDLKQSKYR